MKVDVDYEQILNEIREMQRENPDGFSTYDMSIAIGKSPTWCRRKVRDLIQAKKIKYNGKRSAVRIDGTNGHVPVYCIVE